MKESGPNIGMPHTRSMSNGLFELRLKGKEGIARVFYCTVGGSAYLLAAQHYQEKTETPTKGLTIIPNTNERGEIMSRKTHEELVKQALTKPGVKKTCDDLEEEFALLRKAVKMRQESGKTQEEIAKIMGTTTSAVGRLETGGGKQKHSPTLATLRKYAQALNCDLLLQFVPYHGH